MADEAFKFTIDAAALGDFSREQLAEFFETKLGPRIAENAKRTAPVDTFSLRNAITVHVITRGQDPVLQVGVERNSGQVNDPVDYGLYVEFGTSKMAAQPFLRPAMYQARGRMT